MSEYGDHTHYDTLEVDEDASPEIIESAYQYLCHKWHPKKHPDQSAKAERRLVELNRAYRVISKPEARAEYDHWLLGQRGLGSGGKKLLQESPSSVPPGPAKNEVVSQPPPEADFSDVVATRSQQNRSKKPEHIGSPPPYESGLPEGYEYAGFWERGAALLWDSIIVTALSYGVVFSLGLFWFFAFNESLPDEELFTAIGYVISVAYYITGWSGKKMATPGKRLMGLEVRTVDFKRIGGGAAGVRVAVWTIGALLLLTTYLTQPFTRRRQCLHDMAAGTIVVTKDGSSGPSALMFLAVFIVFFTAVGIVAAIALPAYQDYTTRANAVTAYGELVSAAEAVTENDRRGGGEPSSLSQVGYSASRTIGAFSGPSIYSDEESFFIYVDLAAGGRLAVFPYYDNQNRLLWKCYAYSLSENVVPPACEVWREQN